MLDNGILKLENYADTEVIEVESLLKDYQQLYSFRPIWHLIQDVQQQAMVYTNIIEQLKSGTNSETIRPRFEQLGLVPVGKLPNPHEDALLTKAFNKLSQYRTLLLEIVRRHGRQLVMELSFEAGLTVSIGVNLGFAPSVVIAVEPSANVEATIQNAKSEPA